MAGVVAARSEGKAVKAAVVPRARRISRRLRNFLSKGARRVFMGAVSQRGREKASKLRGGLGAEWLEASFLIGKGVVGKGMN